LILSTQINSKKIATFVGIAAIAGFTQSSGVAIAADEACTTSNPNAITVGNDVCEITFLTTPSADFVVPAGVSAMQALLVGGGSGANAGYTGGGGEVKVVDLTGEGDVAIEVATAAGVAESGKPSKVTQSGEDFIANGGLLADGVAGAPGAGGPGGQDKGNNSFGDIGSNITNSPELNGGNGLVVKDIEGATLFSDVDDCYGGGGSAGNYISGGDDIIAGWVGVVSCGAGTTSVNVETDVVTPVAPLANSGGGAAGFPTGSEGRAGSSGRVVLRYNLEEAAPEEATPEEELANTGTSHTTLPLIAGLLLAAAGAFALKRRSN